MVAVDGLSRTIRQSGLGIDLAHGVGAQVVLGRVRDAVSLDSPKVGHHQNVRREGGIVRCEAHPLEEGGYGLPETGLGDPDRVFFLYLELL